MSDNSKRLYSYDFRYLMKIACKNRKNHVYIQYIHLGIVHLHIKQVGNTVCLREFDERTVFESQFK